MICDVCGETHRQALPRQATLISVSDGREEWPDLVATYDPEEFDIIDVTQTVHSLGISLMEFITGRLVTFCDHCGEYVLPEQSHDEDD